jgi:hypothetical protein
VVPPVSPKEKKKKKKEGERVAGLVRFPGRPSGCLSPFFLFWFFSFLFSISFTDFAY